MQVTGGWRVLAPFRFREYRLLIGALSISIFAEGMWAVVMAMQVIALDDDPASLSLVATCLGAGLVGFVLVGGIAADRINQRSIIIAVEAVNVATVSTVAVLGSLGALRIWHMAVAAAMLGIAAAFFFPAYSALLPRILPADQLLAANGVEGVVRPVFQRAVGPAVAGVLVGLTFPALGAVAVAALFAVGLVLLVATRPAISQRRTPGPTRIVPTSCATCATGSAFMVRHAVAAVDAAVREHVRAGGARPHRGAAAVHRQGPVRRRCADVRLHPGVLRRRQRDRCARRLVGTAAAPLPDGDDDDVGPRLAARW